MAYNTANKTFFILTACVWAIFGIVWYFFPGLTTGNFIALYLISFGYILLTRYTAFASDSASVVMAAATVLVGCGVIINAWYFTAGLGGTPDNPILINPDSNRWWNDALYLLGSTNCEQAPPQHGLYGAILACVLWIFGATVGTALLWSMTILSGALLMVGIVTYRLTSTKVTAVVSMACTAAVCYWLSMGTLILKDAFVIFAMILGAYSFTCRKSRFFAFLAVSATMLALSRPNCILMLVAGILIVYLRHKDFVWSSLAAVLCICLWAAAHTLSLSPNFVYIVSTSYDNDIFFGEQQKAYFNIIGDYSCYPFYKKILILPLSAAVQFMIPFPWNFMRDIPFGLTQAYAHFGYPWYIFGFMTVYFLVSRWRDYSSLIYRLTVWGLVCWLIPCYLFGGTVSRYGLPMVAIFAPAVALTLYRNYKSVRFYSFLGVYCVILAVVLIIAHNLHTSA